MLHFKLFADCKLVLGNGAALLYDLNREKAFPIPNEFARVLDDCNGKTLDSILKTYPETIKSFFGSLIAKDLAFYTEEPENFPDLNLEVKSPSKVYSAIVEIDDQKNYDVADTLKELDLLGCNLLMIAVKPTSNISFKEIESYLTLISDSFITTLELILSSKFEPYFTKEFIANNLRLSSVLYCNAEENACFAGDFDVKVVKTKNEYVEWTETILPSLFNINVEMFGEAQTHNLGLNQKVCVDEYGNIKNYINHEKSFGNVNSKKISELLNDEGFQQKWHISNDQIHTCKECKYRYCCTSNSDLYFKDNTWHKETRCSYDPVEDTWKEN